MAQLPWPDPKDVMIYQNEYAQSRSVWNRCLRRIQENVLAVAAMAGIIDTSTGDPNIIRTPTDIGGNLEFSGKYLKLVINDVTYYMPLYTKE